MNPIEQALVLMLGNGTETLKKFIDEKVDLVDHIKAKYPLVYMLLAKLSTSNPGIIAKAKTMTKDGILEQLRIRRPDLHQVIVAYPGGLEWWARQDIEKFWRM